MLKVMEGVEVSDYTMVKECSKFNRKCREHNLDFAYLYRSEEDANPSHIQIPIFQEL